MNTPLKQFYVKISDYVEQFLRKLVLKIVNVIIIEFWGMKRVVIIEWNYVSQRGLWKGESFWLSFTNIYW